MTSVNYYHFRFFYFSNLNIEISNNGIKYSHILTKTIKKNLDKTYIIISLYIPNHQNLLIVDTVNENIYHLEINGFNFCLKKEKGDYRNFNIINLDKHILNIEWVNLPEKIKNFLNNTNDICNLSLSGSRFNIYYNLFKLFEKILPGYRYHSPFSIISQGPMINFTKEDFKKINIGLDPEGYCVTLTYLY